MAKRKQKMIKINPSPVENSIPVWKGKLEFPIEGEAISSQTEWQEIAPKKKMLIEPTGEHEKNILNLLNYFNSENVIDDLPLNAMAEAIKSEWPIDQILDPAYLKKILNTSVTIVKDEVERTERPFCDTRMTFGKIVVNLTDYLLTPPMLFTSNPDWPTTDVIYEHDYEFLDVLFFLNSNKFYYGSQNNSKRNAYFLVCDLTLEPLFLVDRHS